MDLGIAGRRAAVAAGSAGLGLATAQALVQEGAQVAICGRDPERLSAALAILGPSAVGIEADMSTSQGAQDFANAAAEALGGHIQILVANAGGPPPGLATATSVEQYRLALELNCLSTIALVLETAAAMRAERWGRILAITSIGARQPIPFLAASTAARAATTAFMKNLATEVAVDGVTANTIQPGAHKTARNADLSTEQLQEMLQSIPAARLGSAADFGSVAAFLCSEQASFVCGASIIVDGGASRGLQ
ncbi:MAG: SDR family oxidoreductase [Microthrixaceae bacterium]